MYGNYLAMNISDSALHPQCSYVASLFNEAIKIYKLITTPLYHAKIFENP